MPTEDRILADIFKAVLSVSKATLEEITVPGQFEDDLMYRPVRGYRLTMDHPIVMDGTHAEALVPYVGPIIQEDSES